MSGIHESSSVLRVIVYSKDTRKQTFKHSASASQEDSNPTDWKLREKVNKLQHENDELVAENVQLKRDVQVLREETVTLRQRLKGFTTLETTVAELKGRVNSLSRALLNTKKN